MTELLNKLEYKIGIKFKNKELLIKSLIHKSHNNNENNEKLEFLGDRVLGLQNQAKITKNQKKLVDFFFVQFFFFEKWIFANCLKRVLPKFERDRTEV